MDTVTIPQSELDRLEAVANAAAKLFAWVTLVIPFQQRPPCYLRLAELLKVQLAERLAEQRQPAGHNV